MSNTTSENNIMTEFQNIKVYGVLLEHMSIELNEFRFHLMRKVNKKAFCNAQIADQHKISIEFCIEFPEDDENFFHTFFLSFSSRIIYAR